MARCTEPNRQRRATRRPPPWPRLLAVTVAGGLLAFAPACNQRRTPSPVQRDTQREARPTSAGLATLTGEDGGVVIDSLPADSFESTRRQVLESAALLEQMIASAEAPPEPEPFPEPLSVPETVAPGRTGESSEPTRFSLSAFASGDEANTELGAAGAPEFDQGPAEPEPEPEPVARAEPPPAVAADPETRKQELVDELVGVLRELAVSGQGPESSALALAGLESLRPAALDALKGEGLLSDAEVASLDAARELFRAMSSEGGIADPGEVSGVLDRIRRELDARAGLRITRAELCTRVTGFGRYETFPANRFVAGRAQPVIVYAEVDRFGHRESTGPDGAPRYETELSQRLELYHVADDLNTWNRAAEVDKTSSRNRVRDYYLINQVTLPANLTIGKYHLKVVMRDLVTGGMAETIIPIEIVAGSGSGRR